MLTLSSFCSRYLFPSPCKHVEQGSEWEGCPRKVLSFSCVWRDVPMLEGFHLCHILFLSRAFLVLFGSMSVVFAKTQQACHLSASDSTEEEKSSEQTLWII